MTKYPTSVVFIAAVWMAIGGLLSGASLFDLSNAIDHSGGGMQTIAALLLLSVGVLLLFLVSLLVRQKIKSVPLVQIVSAVLLVAVAGWWIRTELSGPKFPMADSGSLRVAARMAQELYDQQLLMTRVIGGMLIVGLGVAIRITLSASVKEWLKPTKPQE